MGADLRSLRDVRGHAGAAIVHKQAAASAQQDDRGHMSVALQQELANRLMKMDETKMKSVFLLAPGWVHVLLNLRSA